MSVEARIGTARKAEQRGPHSAPSTPEQTASYVHEMAASLRRMAQAHQQTVLAMILEMAALEAARLVEQQEKSDGAVQEKRQKPVSIT